VFGLAIAQGICLRRMGVIEQLLIDAAKDIPDPHKYLATLFKRVSLNLDRTTDAIQRRTVFAIERENLAKSFSTVQSVLISRVPKRRGRQKSGPVRNML